MGHPQCKTGGSIIWSGAVQQHPGYTHFTAVQTQNCYFLVDTVVTHQVEVQDTPWKPQCSHILLIQTGTVSCLEGLTKASITDLLKY